MLLNLTNQRISKMPNIRFREGRGKSGAPLNSRDAIGTARYVLFKAQSTRHWFIWPAIVPVLSIAIGVCYLQGWHAQGVRCPFVYPYCRARSFFVRLFDWSLALWVVLPSYWGFLGVRQA